MTELVPAVVLALAGLGYLGALQRRADLHPAFGPAVVLTGWGVAAYVGGVLGVLPQSVAAIVAVGVGLLLVGLLRWRAGLARVLLARSLWLFAAGGVVLGLFLQGRKFTHYDNFSHWALIVKVMLGEDRLPTLADPLLTFRSYVPGSAALVYTIGRPFEQPPEWVLMLAQSLLLAALVLPLIAFGGRRRGVAAVAAVGSFVVVASHIGAVDTLLVDGLLAAITGCAVLLVAKHRRTLARHTGALAIVVTFLVLTKASGALFAAAIVLVAAAVLPASTSRWGWLVRVVGLAAAPAAAYGLWMWHLERTFAGATLGKHTGSLGQLEELAAAKSAAERTEILAGYWTHLRDDRLTYVLAAVGFLVVALLVATRRLAWWRAALGCLALVAGCAAYVIALAGLYVTSMPTSEALHLAGIRRYLGTLHGVVFLLVVAGLLVLAQPAPRPRLRWISVLGVVGAVALPVVVAFEYSAPGGRIVSDPRLTSVRDQVDRAAAGLDPSGIPAADMPVCLVLPQADSGYRRVVSRYVLSVDITQLTVSAASSPGILRRCASVVVLASSPAIEDRLQSAGFPTPPPAPYVLTR